MTQLIDFAQRAPIDPATFLAVAENYPASNEAKAVAEAQKAAERRARDREYRRQHPPPTRYQIARARYQQALAAQLHQQRTAAAQAKARATRKTRVILSADEFATVTELIDVLAARVERMARRLNTLDGRLPP